MIVKNKNLDIPHGNTVIWRYVGLDKFLDLLISQELFFSNAAKMSDKYEGLIPKRNQDYLLKSIKLFTPLISSSEDRTNENGIFFLK